MRWNRPVYLSFHLAHITTLKTVVIVLVFIFGSFISRRPFRQSARPESSPLLPPTVVQESSDIRPDPSWVTAIKPDNTRFRKNISSRILAAFPFLTEIGYWNLTYWTYQLARALSAVRIREGEEVYNRSRQHALSVLSFEKNYHFSLELSIQRWILKHAPWLFGLLSAIYYSHIVVSVAFLAYTYATFPRILFQSIRRTMAACNLIAFIIFTIYRVMPPRLLPEKYGFVDVLHPPDEDSDPSWTNNRYQLTIAAMPSLHFGISALIAWCLFYRAPHKAIRVLAIFWPATMLFTILATANHFLLDAFVGGLVPIISWLVSDVWLIFRPLEEWLYWLCRTEKPLAADQDPLWLQRQGKNGDSAHDERD
jgi:hypothetical protein